MIIIDELILSFLELGSILAHQAMLRERRYAVPRVQHRSSYHRPSGNVRQGEAFGVASKQGW